MRSKDDEQISKYLLYIELIGLASTCFCIFWLKNVIVGVFYLILAITISTWLVLFILTINYRNQIKTNEKSKSTI